MIMVMNVMVVIYENVVFDFILSVVLGTVVHYNKALLIYSTSTETKKKREDGEDFTNFLPTKMPNYNRQSECLKQLFSLL